MSNDNYSRQSARKVLATELNSAYLMNKVGDDERSPTYLVLPSGAKAGRVVIAGVLTETRDVGTDNTYMQAKVCDPTGANYWAYAGQYQQEAMQDLMAMKAPEHVVMVAKPRIYEKDDGTVNVSLQPEHIAPISSETYDRWTLEAAQDTVGRLKGERGSADGTQQAEAAYSDELRVDALEAAIEALESLEVEESEVEAEAEDDVYTEAELESMDYNDLRSAASEFEGISGNAPKDALVEALKGQPVA